MSALINRYRATQREREDASQVQNRAGGFVYEVPDKSRLERILILGVDGGTYYIGERQLSMEAISFVKELIARDETLVRDTIVDVSVNGRAYRNVYAVELLALLFAEGQNKVAAREAFDKVVRTGTDLFTFLSATKQFGGFGRAKREAVASFYTRPNADLQVVKYRQRNGWTHRDALRLSHAKTDLAPFVLGKGYTGDSRVIEGFQRAQAAKTWEELKAVLTDSRLPWEVVPTEFHKDLRLWRLLFEQGNLRGQALVRNVKRIAELGGFDDLAFAAEFAEALTDEEMIRQTRLHPVNFLNARVVYSDGSGNRSNYGFGIYRSAPTYRVQPVIRKALETGFYRSFGNVKPANKRTMLALDVSASMSIAASGTDISCAQASAVVAMAVARTEPAHIFRAFSGGNAYSRDSLMSLDIAPGDSFNEVMKKISRLTFGATDCALPMLKAEQEGLEIDTFVVLTDSETWAGNKHPMSALRDYRKSSGIPAKLAVFGLEGDKFSIADPKDAGSMDFVGFDANAVRALSDFSAGRL